MPGEARGEEHERRDALWLLERGFERDPATSRGPHERGALHAGRVKDGYKVMDGRVRPRPHRRLPEPALVVTDHACVAGEKGDHAVPDPRVDNALVQQDNWRIRADVLIPKVGHVRDASARAHGPGREGVAADLTW
jgi:hypothetical protein